MPSNSYVTQATGSILRFHIHHHRVHIYDDDGLIHLDSLCPIVNLHWGKMCSFCLSVKNIIKKMVFKGNIPAR